MSPGDQTIPMQHTSGFGELVKIAMVSMVVSGGQADARAPANRALHSYHLAAESHAGRQ